MSRLNIIYLMLSVVRLEIFEVRLEKNLFFQMKVAECKKKIHQTFGPVSVKSYHNKHFYQILSLVLL